MANEGKVKVGIIGSQFQADIHAASLQIMPEAAEVVAVGSPTPGNASAFAKNFRIPRVFIAGDLINVAVAPSIRS
jgi:predicted dehydrogenase